MLKTIGDNRSNSSCNNLSSFSNMGHSQVGFQWVSTDLGNHFWGFNRVGSNSILLRFFGTSSSQLLTISILHHIITTTSI